MTPRGVLALTQYTAGRDPGSCNDEAVRLASDVQAVGIMAVSFADVNGDGHADAVVALGNETAAVLWNDGNDVWSSKATLPVSPGALLALSVGDFNGDGGVDVVFAGSANASTLLLHTGVNGLVPHSGTTAALATLGTVSATAAVDVNGDGWLELWTVSSAGCVVLSGPQRSPVTASRELCGVGGFLRGSVAVGDVDNDGDVDAYVCGLAQSNATAVSVLLLNSGSGEYAVAADRVPAAKTVPCWSVGFGDMNGDGTLDLFMSLRASQSSLVLNNGSGWFLDAVNVSTPVTVVVAVAVDVNGDGVDDVPAAGYLSSPSSPPATTVAIRPLGRNGGWNQFGAVVCVYATGSGARLGCRVVDGGGGSHGQGVYDVTVALADTADVSHGVDVTVGFTNGHLHSADTASALGAIDVTLAQRTCCVPIHAVLGLSMFRGT